MAQDYLLLESAVTDTLVFENVPLFPDSMLLESSTGSSGAVIGARLRDRDNRRATLMLLGELA